MYCGIREAPSHFGEAVGTFQSFTWDSAFWVFNAVANLAYGRYRDMIATPAEAAGRLRPGNRVFVGTGCGTPTVLVEALVKRLEEAA